MTQRIWNGGTGDWYNVSDWTTSNGTNSYPLPGDVAIVAGGTAILDGAEGKTNGTFDATTVTAGNPFGGTLTLELEGTVLNHGFAVTLVGSTEIWDSTGRSTLEGPITDTASGTTLTLSGGGNLAITHGASLNMGTGTTLHLQGAITVEAGAGFTTAAGVAVVNDATVTQIGAADDIEGSLTGTGTWNLEFSTTLLLDGSVSSGQTITFGDVDGRLRLGAPGSFAGTVSGFGPGNLIDFTTISATSATYDAATQQLVLTSGGTVVETLSNVTAASGTLVASSDGGSGTLVSYAGTGTRESYEITGASVAMGANLVRATDVPGTTTPITGAGVKIGIISTSFNVDGMANADAKAGYLPETAIGTSAVKVLVEGSAGSDDEGRAMAELIYAAAPGAALDFAADGASQTTMAASIDALVADGCNVIVDDITFFDTPFYQVAGPLDTAVEAALAAGVDYFTAAGNYGEAYLDQTVDLASATLHDGTVAQAQVFSNKTPYDGLMLTSGTTVRIDLQPTDPYLGANGQGAPNTLAFKIFDPSGSIVATSSQVSEGVPTSDTYVSFTVATTGTYQIAVYMNSGSTAPTPLGFKFVVQSTGSGTSPGGIIDDPAAGNGTGDVRGQQLIPQVNTVGAVFYGETAAFGEAPTTTEYFSDSGPGELLYDSTGAAYATAQSAGKVDFLAPDGVNTPVPGFAGFFGTSAAAPDAAAVAALLLQAEPTLTQAQVTAALEASGTSLPDLPVDVQGAGMINAVAALDYAESVACYCRGTLIATPGGERPVEALAPGDLVLTASGRLRPVRWVGRRDYAGRFLRARPALRPVRFHAGSLGPGLPRRDLLVSPDHAMALDGVLVPARCLVDGRTITWERGMDPVAYVHVELDAHDLLLAEGAPSESFADDGSRGMFANAADASVRTRTAAFCAPRVDSGPVLGRIRARLDDQLGVRAAA